MMGTTSGPPAPKLGDGSRGGPPPTPGGGPLLGPVPPPPQPQLPPEPPPAPPPPPPPAPPPPGGRIGTICGLIPPEPGPGRTGGPPPTPPGGKPGPIGGMPPFPPPGGQQLHGLGGGAHGPVGVGAGAGHVPQPRPSAVTSGMAPPPKQPPGSPTGGAHGCVLSGALAFMASPPADAESSGPGCGLAVVVSVRREESFTGERSAPIALCARSIGRPLHLSIYGSTPSDTARILGFFPDFRIPVEATSRLTRSPHLRAA